MLGKKIDAFSIWEALKACQSATNVRTCEWPACQVMFKGFRCQKFWACHQHVCKVRCTCRTEIFLNMYMCMYASIEVLQYMCIYMYVYRINILWISMWVPWATNSAPYVCLSTYLSIYVCVCACGIYSNPCVQPVVQNWNLSFEICFSIR